MVILDKRRAASAERSQNIRGIDLVAARKHYPPDELHEHSGRIIAIWYALPPGTATLTMSSDLFLLNATEVVLTAGKVTTVRETLALKREGVTK